MTAKEALIQSIYKYTWCALNPCTPLEPKRFVDCALCKHSKEQDELLPSNDGCENCIMFNMWPALNKGDAETCDFGAWDYWDDLTIEREQGKYKNSYDFVFFSLLMVEAFHFKLQELYKNDKNKT